MNNFVTPIQRRAKFPEYLMEMCLRLPVSESKLPRDWVVGYDGDLTKHSWDLAGIVEASKLIAGTTVRPASGYERYARRVAFRRNSNGQLVKADNADLNKSTVVNPAYERNGGLHNFARFLENWDGVDTNISGSFIQFQRSVYATAPYQVLVRPSPNGAPTPNSLFNRTLNNAGRPGYNTDSTPQGEAPFYMAPNRNWGFDVALLSQNPDLFAQRFVIPATDPPNEYYREVSRDDRWVKTLLCAVQKTTTKDGFTSKTITIDDTPTDF